jgi:hypothetical protein
MDECRHGVWLDMCANCAPPPRGTNARVWVTADGNEYHNAHDCSQLEYWQNVPAKEGSRKPEKKRIPWVLARLSRSRCLTCVPPER